MRPIMLTELSSGRDRQRLLSPSCCRTHRLSKKHAISVSGIPKGEVKSKGVQTGRMG